MWHGFPDIVVDRATVKVTMNQAEDDSEETDEFTEPAAKRCKVINNGERQNVINTNPSSEGTETLEDECTSYIEVEKDIGMDSVKTVQQALAQTITNAFYQTKQNENLKDLCIPSFLISADEVKIIMYNCQQDTLYMSFDMPLWENDGNLNAGTIFCLWFALNFENFQNHVKRR